MLRTPPFFPPKSGKKPYLEVLSRFGLWRDFLNDNIQATISAFRSIKNLSINPRSVEFHQCNAKPHSIFFFFFFFHIIKDNERNLCQDLLTMENTDSELKVHALHYANELLVRVRLSFQKLLQNRSTYRNNTKKCSGKEYCRVLVVDKSTDHDKPYFNFYVLMFFMTISTSKKMFSFRARAEKGIAQHIDPSSVAGTW